MPILSMGNLVAARRSRPAAKTYYPSVQGLRGFSAFSVLLEHVYRMAQHGGLTPALSPIAEFVLPMLGNAVGLFFIISGFVIPASLVRHGNLRRFFVDRLLRVLPVFVAIHMLVFTAGPLVGYKWFAGATLSQYLTLFVSNVTFTAPLLDLPVVQQNSWTLTYEWLFYIFVAIFWFAATKIRRPTPALLVLTVGGALLCWQYTICWFFVIGIAFAQIGSVHRRVNRAVEIVVMPLTLIAFFVVAAYDNDYPVLPLAAVLFWFVLQQGSLTSQLLGTRLMQFLGLISYSLYLVHPIVMYPLEMVGVRLVRHGFSQQLVFPVFAVASVVLAVAVSVVSHRLLEVEARRRLAIWVDRLSRDGGAVRLSGSRASRP